MTLVDRPIVNSEAVYIQVKTDRVFQFNSREEMSNFMKYKFYNPAAEPASAYCNQQPSQPKLFNCIFLYPSSVPLFEFVINLSFSRDSFTGNLDVSVDYKQSSFAIRSLK